MGRLLPLAQSEQLAPLGTFSHAVLTLPPVTETSSQVQSEQLPLPQSI